MPQCHDSYDLGGYPEPGPVPEARAHEVPCHDSYDPYATYRSRRARRAARALRARAAASRLARAGGRADVPAGK